MEITTSQMSGGVHILQNIVEDFILVQNVHPYHQRSSAQQSDMGYGHMMVRNTDRQIGGKAFYHGLRLQKNELKCELISLTCCVYP